MEGGGLDVVGVLVVVLVDNEVTIEVDDDGEAVIDVLVLVDTEVTTEVDDDREAVVEGPVLVDTEVTTEVDDDGETVVEGLVLVDTEVTTEVNDDGEGVVDVIVLDAAVLTLVETVPDVDTEVLLVGGLVEETGVEDVAETKEASSYRSSLSLPPQNSLLFPEQGYEQSVTG